MAVFGQGYTPPGVYTTVVQQAVGSPLFSETYIPVIIGEGTQSFTQSNVELFRGSSSNTDDQAVNENISNQVTGLTRQFQTTYYPVVDGSGKGISTVDPSKIQVSSVDPDGNQIPVTVISLNGATGQFSTQTIIPQGYELFVTYSFKRGDTQIINESLLSQVPSFASLVVGGGGNTVTLAPTNPGILGNNLSLQLVDSGIALTFTLTAAATATGSPATTLYTGTITGGASNAFVGFTFTVTGFTTTGNNGTFTCVGSTGTNLTLANTAGSAETHAGSAASATGGIPDASAVTGAGTDAITINIRKANGTFRALSDLANLVNAGITTLDGGLLTISATVGVQSTALTATGAALFTGGAGQGTNKVFKVQHTPITDGTNGGVTTSIPTDVTVLVNGLPVTVTAVDGTNGLVTLATGVLATASSVSITYFYNTWQNTFDLLPANSVESIVQIGIGPNRADFVQDVDYTLGVDANGNGTVVWGPAVSSAIGISAAGETANFTPAEVVTALVDERMHHRLLTGAVNGKNAVFTLPDVPTDGSGLAIPTDNPALIQVYVGQDPLEAFLSGTVTVVRLAGKSQTVTLKNPPAAGNVVVASYYRNVLSTHEYSIVTVNAGYAGAGTYIVKDELGRVAPLVTFNLAASTITQNAGFQATGVVYPNGFSDAQAVAGAAVDETVTLTFNSDGNATLTPAVQASKVLTFTGSTLTFTASTPGLPGNSVQVAVDVSSLNATPVVVSGNLVTIYANWAGVLETLSQIAAHFPSTPTLAGGVITCAAAGTAPTTQTPVVTAAVNFTGGSNAVMVPVTHSYTVTTSASAHGSGSAGSNVGYLDQTYVDLATGFRVTIINPSDHASYGVPSIPASYVFQPGDVLKYVVAADAVGGTSPAVRSCGTPGVLPAQANNLIAIPGLHTTVISNFQSTALDSVVVSTFSGSGNDPAIGSFYFVSFTTGKTAADYGLKLYTNAADAYTAYGQPSTVNRVSLGVQFMVENGCQIFGVIQVPVIPGTNQASDSDFIAAIQELAMALPGTSDQHVNVIVPLSTSDTVHQALSTFLSQQATPRQKGEAIGFVGFDQFTGANAARQKALALHNNRIIAIGNPVAGILITDPLTGVSVEYPVSGEFMAAAAAGLQSSPAVDPATSLTNQSLVGFTRLLKRYDNTTMDLMAGDGLTMLVEDSGALEVRHYKSTDPSNPITSEPTSTTAIDYTAQKFRGDMKQFIGRKLVDSLVTDAFIVASARFASLVTQQILSGYKNLSLIPDPSDPTVVNGSAAVKPMFSLLYINFTFQVTTTL